MLDICQLSVTKQATRTLGHRLGRTSITPWAGLTCVVVSDDVVEAGKALKSALSSAQANLAGVPVLVLMTGPADIGGMLTNGNLPRENAVALGKMRVL
jgi:hypothetical protein